MLGDKNFPEEYILGDLYQQALQAQGLHRQAQAEPRIDRDRLEGAAERPDPGLPRVRRHAAGDGRRDQQERRRTRRRRRPRRLPGRRSTATCSRTSRRSPTRTRSRCTTAYAKKNGLKTLGDLKKLGASVTLGGAAEFSTRYPDGLLGLQRIYGDHPTFAPLNISDFYNALDSGQVDAAVVFTTDPPLKTGKYVVLKDTKFIFGFQNVGLVVKQSVATAEGPAFTSTVNAVSRLLNQQAIIALNSAVEVDKQSAAKVAAAFLKANHLL